MLVLFEALARPSLEFSPLCAVYAMMDYNAFFYYKVPVALTVQKNIFHKENSRELSGEAIKIRGSKNRSTKKNISSQLIFSMKPKKVNSDFSLSCLT